MKTKLLLLYSFSSILFGGIWDFEEIKGLERRHTEGKERANLVDTQDVLSAEEGDEAALTRLLKIPERNNDWVKSVSPLMVASAKGCTNVVRKLLEARADVNWQTWGRVTALHWAANGDISEMLLEAGAYPDAASTNFLMLGLGHGSLAEYPSEDADRDSRAALTNYILTSNPKQMGCTPLHLAVERLGKCEDKDKELHLGVIRFLFKKGATPMGVNYGIPSELAGPHKEKFEKVWQEATGHSTERLHELESLRYSIK